MAECLTTSSTVTGRLCFYVSVRDSRLHGAQVVPVCPGNVFVFIFCLRDALLFPSCSSTKKKKNIKNKCDILCVDAVHAVKSVPREASERDQYQQTTRMRCLHAAKPDAKPHEAAPTAFMSYGK